MIGVYEFAALIAGVAVTSILIQTMGWFDD